MDGLQECFKLQQKSFQKKIDIRNKKIEGLQQDIEKHKEEFYEFKQNSTVKAYFRKYGDDVVMKTGRKERHYLPELVKAVDEFLETDGRILENTDTYEGRQVMK